MRRSASLAVLVCLAASPALFAQAGGPDFRAMMRKTLDAWETLDPAKAAPFYAKDAGLAFFDIAPLKYTGWTEAAAGATQTFAGFSSLKFTLNDDARVERRGSVAWGTATVRADVVTKDGTPMPLNARWTLIWEKRGRDWLIVHDHFSAPLPEPAPAATR